MNTIAELEHLLVSPKAPPIIEAPSALALDPGLAKALEAQGYFVALVDRAPVFSKETLMHALYQSCEFPAYFGFNWDALYDQLSEPNQGHVLMFKNFALLQERSPQDAEMLKEVVKDATAARQAAQAAPLCMLIAKG